MRRVLFRLIPICLACCLPGCAIVEVGVRNPVPGLESVAVAPFFNLSQESSVDGRDFALAYYSELQKVPGFEVLPVGVTERALIENNLDLSGPEDAVKLARILNVDAVVVGAITDYDPYEPRVGLKIAWYSPQQWLFLPNDNPNLNTDKRTGRPKDSEVRAQSPDFEEVEEGDWESVDGETFLPPVARAESPQTNDHPRSVEVTRELRRDEVVGRVLQPTISEPAPTTAETVPRPATSESESTETSLKGSAAFAEATSENTVDNQVSKQKATATSIIEVQAEEPKQLPQTNAQPIDSSPPVESPTNSTQRDTPAITTPLTVEISKPNSGTTDPFVGDANPANSGHVPAEPIDRSTPRLNRTPRLSQAPRPPALAIDTGRKPRTDGQRTLLFPEPDSPTTEPNAGVPALVYDEDVVIARKPYDTLEPLMAYVRLFDSTDARLVSRLADYLELSGETRSGDLEAYMKRSDFFRKFTAHVMISEMLMLHGGESRRRFVLKRRKYR